MQHSDCAPDYDLMGKKLLLPGRPYQLHLSKERSIRHAVPRVMLKQTVFYFTLLLYYYALICAWGKYVYVYIYARYIALLKCILNKLLYTAISASCAGIGCCTDTCLKQIGHDAKYFLSACSLTPTWIAFLILFVLSLAFIFINCDYFLIMW